MSIPIRAKSTSTFCYNAYVKEIVRELSECLPWHQCHNVPVSQEALLVTLLEFYLLFLHLVNFIKYGMGSNKYGVTLLALVPIMLLISGSAAMYKNIFFFMNSL